MNVPPNTDPCSPPLALSLRLNQAAELQRRRNGEVESARIFSGLYVGPGGI